MNLPDKNIPTSRAPIILALEEADKVLTEAELLRMERHMTTTFTAEQVKELQSIGARLDDNNGSISDIKSDGVRAWKILERAQPRLRELLERAKQSRHPQPIAWTGRSDLLIRIYRALLMARFGETDDAQDFLSVGCGAHYFNPLSASSAQRTVQRRSDNP